MWNVYTTSFVLSSFVLSSSAYHFDQCWSLTVTVKVTMSVSETRLRTVWDNEFNDSCVRSNLCHQVEDINKSLCLCFFQRGQRRLWECCAHTSVSVCYPSVQPCRCRKVNLYCGTALSVVASRHSQPGKLGWFPLAELDIETDSLLTKITTRSSGCSVSKRTALIKPWRWEQVNTNSS